MVRPDPSNAYYAVIQDRLDQMKLGNVFIYTVEGWPSLETMPELKAKGVRNITLMPMMMVALAIMRITIWLVRIRDSHKSILEANGFKVTPYIHGIGEIRQSASLREESQ